MFKQLQQHASHPQPQLRGIFHSNNGRILPRYSDIPLIFDCPDAKILGLSATNIRYLDNNRDMAEELFDGHIASEMTLGEAIVRGILPAPKYVTTVYQYQKELARYHPHERPR